MLKEQLDIENVGEKAGSEKTHGEKAEINWEQLFVNSYDLKTKKNFEKSKTSERKQHIY